MSESTRITFSERGEPGDCSLCGLPGSLAPTSVGLLCATCVLQFLRKPSVDLRDASQEADPGSRALARDLHSVTAAISRDNPAA